MNEDEMKDVIADEIETQLAQRNYPEGDTLFEPTRKWPLVLGLMMGIAAVGGVFLWRWQVIPHDWLQPNAITLQLDSTYLKNAADFCRQNPVPAVAFPVADRRYAVQMPCEEVIKRNERGASR